MCRLLWRLLCCFNCKQFQNEQVEDVTADDSLHLHEILDNLTVAEILGFPEVIGWSRGFIVSNSAESQ